MAIGTRVGGHPAHHAHALAGRSLQESSVAYETGVDCRGLSGRLEGGPDLERTTDHRTASAPEHGFEHAVVARRVGTVDALAVQAADARYPTASPPSGSALPYGGCFGR